MFEQALVNYSVVTDGPLNRATAEQLQILYTRYDLAVRCSVHRDVLEAACGAGVGLGLLERVARRTVAGDIDERNCELARRTYRQNPGIEIHQLDAERMPFPAAAFDVVILYEAIYYLRSVDAFLAEAKRILRPGGTLLISSVNCRWRGFNPSPFSTRYYEIAELATLLAHYGFSFSLYGGFPEKTEGVPNRLIGLVRKAAIDLQLIPRSQKSKEWLKRIFYGRLYDIPAELVPGAVAPGALVELRPPYDAGQYSFFYSVGVLL